jgi:hypothetical protein
MKKQDNFRFNSRFSGCSLAYSKLKKNYLDLDVAQICFGYRFGFKTLKTRQKSNKGWVGLQQVVPPISKGYLQAHC